MLLSLADLAQGFMANPDGVLCIASTVKAILYPHLLHSSNFITDVCKDDLADQGAKLSSTPLYVLISYSIGSVGSSVSLLPLVEKLQLI